MSSVLALLTACGPRVSTSGTSAESPGPDVEAKPSFLNEATAQVVANGFDVGASRGVAVEGSLEEAEIVSNALWCAGPCVVNEGDAPPVLTHNNFSQGSLYEDSNAVRYDTLAELHRALPSASQNVAEVTGWGFSWETDPYDGELVCSVALGGEHLGDDFAFDILGNPRTAPTTIGPWEFDEDCF